MFGDGCLVLQPRQQPVPRRMGVGHGLKRREGLRRDDEHRLFGVEIDHRLGEIGSVDIGDEAENHIAGAILAECLIGHDRPQVRAADADIDDIANPLAGMAFPGAAAHAVCEVRHLIENGMNLGHDILPVDDDGRAFGCA